MFFGVNLLETHFNEPSCYYTVFALFQSKLHPTVGLQTPGEIVDVNFGQQPFVFDIEAKRQVTSVFFILFMYARIYKKFFKKVFLSNV